MLLLLLFSLKKGLSEAQQLRDYFFTNLLAFHYILLSTGLSVRVKEIVDIDIYFL